jgi:murein DD-endopeptidase MepM/ murein hydrolase activator NlpD
MENTHYWLARPLGQGAVRSAAVSYPYGGHRNQRSPVHQSVDMVNPYGTPVLAAADGVVYYAGSDQAHSFGARPNFYGNLLILQHGLVAPEGGAVFTLYGHLS